MAKLTFQKYGLEEKDKLKVELLESILEQLELMNEKLERLLTSRPSPS